MESIRKEALLWAYLIPILLIWIAVLRLTETPLSINWEAAKKLPDAVTVFVVIKFAFTKWLWRKPWFQGWLVRVPDLQGTWEGELQSTWEDPETHKRIPGLRVILIIRQEFSSINCTMYTKESESYSRAAQIAVDDSNGSITLSYSYTNRSKATVRDRSPMHDGAAHLRVATLPMATLEGEYWTGRCTTGYMRLTYFSKDLLEGFPQDGVAVIRRAD